MTHELKILPEYFDEVFTFTKTFEVRKNDRDFNQGDEVLLQEFDGENYTGNEMKFTIGFILYGGQFGIEEGYCVFSLIN